MTGRLIKAKRDTPLGNFGYRIMVKLAEPSKAKDLVDGWFVYDIIKEAGGAGATKARRIKIGLDERHPNQKLVTTREGTFAFTEIKVMINPDPAKAKTESLVAAEISCKQKSCPPSLFATA